MATVKMIAIKSCEKCPFLEVHPVRTGDSFEVVVKWRCKKLDRIIREPFDLPSERKFPIPEECPLETVAKRYKRRV